MNIKLFDNRYVYLEWSDELEGKDCILAKTYQDLKDFVNSGDEGRIFKVNKGNEKPFTNGCSECDFCYYDSNLKVKKAWIDGKKVQYYSNFDKWQDLNLIETCDIEDYLHNEDWDEYEWRIKPNEKIAECYYINIHELDNMNTIDISKHAYNPIFWGSIKQCDYVLKLITDKFRLDKCLYRCKNTKCYKCDKLLNFVKNIEFKSTRRMTNRELSEWLAKGNGEVKNLGCIINTSISYCYKDDTENEIVDGGIFIRDFGSDEWRQPLIEV